MTIEERVRPAVLAPAKKAAWWWSIAEVRWAGVATALFVLGLAARLAGAPGAVGWALFLACYAAGGWEPGRAGLQALRERRLDVDLLMVVAALGAAAIGQVVDGALLIVIFATSGAVESVATRRTEDSVRRLLDLAPESANRLGPDGEQVVAAADLEVGDLIVVRPGERIGADGSVADGASEVDQSGITGEPLPVDKLPGDEVFAGTVNGGGALHVRVSRPAADSVVARIVALVEQAGATKARTQLFIEKVEQRYAIGMVAATVALFVVPLLFGAALRPTLLRAMTFMIVASPCAVVLATMPPLLSAIANAGRHGVLVKSAVVMERIGQITRVGFDKTGTLTEGNPRLSAVRPLSAPAHDGRRLLALAAAAEDRSEHPLARAIVAAARQAGIALPAARSFASSPGQGVTAEVDGHLIRIGSPHRLLAPSVSPSPHPAHPDRVTRARADPEPSVRADSGSPVRVDSGSPLWADSGLPARTDSGAPDSADGAAWAVVAELERAGETAVVVLVDGRAVGVLGLSDRLRPAAGPAVAALAAVTGAPPMLLTGDNATAAARVAGEAGIGHVDAGLLPDEKVGRVREQTAAGHRLMLVGDGVNDAPALAAAHVGVAMGRSGSDLSVATADAVLVHDDLSALAAVVGLSRRARRLVAANLVVAAAFIAVLVGWDLAGHLPLPLGVAGHEGSTVIVGLNGLRLLRNAAWRKAG